MRRLLALLCLCAGIAHAEEFDAPVIAVLDGDTVMVLHNGQKLKVRLANIDAPELEQAYGKESRQALAEQVLKKQVRVKRKATDAYGRMIADISVGGQSINEAQLRKGMAWEYSHFHRDQRYVSLSQQARQSRRGLWAQSAAPMEPEKWRKAHPEKLNTNNKLQKNRGATICGSKHLCSQMVNCEEAKIYYLHCGVKTLDGDGNGVPCESLCGADELVKFPKGVKLLPASP